MYVYEILLIYLMFWFLSIKMKTIHLNFIGDIIFFYLMFVNELFKNLRKF